MNRLARVCLLGLAMALLASCSEDDKDGVEEPSRDAGEESPGDGGPCIQVEVWARPPAGGECQAFGTPCDVPEGFVECCGRGIGACFGTAQCVDDPTDTCTPETGNSECQSICQ